MTSLFPLPSPTLPAFTTLAVKGSYHPSALVHLCLTHVVDKPDNKVIVLSPSREKVSNALREFNDDWLNECGGYGAVVQPLSNVNMFYPPSPAHLAFLLSAFKVSEASDDPSLPSRTILRLPPSLIVLHELSAYFLDEYSSNSNTLASYMSLVAHTMSMSVSLSAHTPETPVAVVLMDSRLDQLKLPILKRPVMSAIADDEVHEEANRSYRRESVTTVVQQYFEWVGTFESDHLNSVVASQSAESPFTHKLSLRRTRSLDSAPEITWRWKQRDAHARGSNDHHGTLFTWK